MIAAETVEDMAIPLNTTGLSNERAGTYKDRESVSKTNPDKRKIQLDSCTYPIIYKPVNPEKITLENSEIIHNFI